MLTRTELQERLAVIESQISESPPHVYNGTLHGYKEVIETAIALEEVLADKRRDTRELDVALCGEKGAARQASLIDLIYSAKHMRETLRSARHSLDQIAEYSNYTGHDRAFYQMQKIAKSTRALLDTFL